MCGKKVVEKSNCAAKKKKKEREVENINTHRGRANQTHTKKNVNNKLIFYNFTYKLIQPNLKFIQIYFMSLFTN